MQLGSISVVPPSPAVPLPTTAEVLLAEDIGAELRRLVLAVPALFRRVWRLGQTLDVLVAAAQWRRYLIARFDADLCRVEIVVSLGSTGPGSLWAACAGPGDLVQVRGPSGSGLVDLAEPRHVLVGDETAVGFAIGLAELRPALQIDGMLELPSWSSADVVHLGLPFEVVVRRPGSPGVFAARILDAIGPAHAIHHVIGASSFAVRIASVLAAAGAPCSVLVTWTDAP